MSPLAQDPEWLKGVSVLTLKPTSLSPVDAPIGSDTLLDYSKGSLTPGGAKGDEMRLTFDLSLGSGRIFLVVRDAVTNDEVLLFLQKMSRLFMRVQEALLAAS
ncbi:MAG: hypothetical protein D6750_10285 [Bacteroidetes bacterium]|nr:MAG: hypothetical protein D6750_10285 [Bacteroidota bacterium]